MRQPNAHHPKTSNNIDVNNNRRIKMDKSTEMNTASPQVIHYEENEIEIESVSKSEMNHQLLEEYSSESTNMKKRTIHATRTVKAEKQEQQQEMIIDLSAIGKRSNTSNQTQEQINDSIEYDKEQYDPLLYEPLDYEKDWSLELQMALFNYLSLKMDFDKDSMSYSPTSITSEAPRKKAKFVL
jgi:hypothetical protein